MCDKTIFDAFGGWENINSRSSVILKFHYRGFGFLFSSPNLSFCCEKLHKIIIRQDVGAWLHGRAGGLGTGEQRRSQQGAEGSPAPSDTDCRASCERGLGLAGVSDPTSLLSSSCSHGRARQEGLPLVEARPAHAGQGPGSWAAAGPCAPAGFSHQDCGLDSHSLCS